ncbi:hypothetical protein V474_08085 [Novosphingobium barchaimii LL02]|uniref:Lipoprotein n=1 Tax=Novosphingobium barchaimii LL02 TaxID=1114963 RepID=A0A0J7Y6A5_9SPHN|nr:hypothetical protein [Novosphingobium barchaimii]KMS59172.1 hypothetical protein V474_08085 [Novosphingobium barchaimii LL02]
MLRSVVTAAIFAIALAGCTVIPAADPSRMPKAYPQAAPASYPQNGPGNYPEPVPMAQPLAPTPAQPPSQPYPSELPAAETGAPLTFAALGQTVTVDGPRVTPLAVLEDSRCPMNARCVWGGQLRLRLRIDSGRGGEIEITSGKPITIADGTLELVQVRPDKVAGAANNGAIRSSDYRFGFRFMGGY